MLGECHQISQHCINYVCDRLTNLRLLRVETEVNNEHLYTISRSCTKLEKLNLNNDLDITDAGLLSLHKLKDLTSLTLGFCKNITDDGIEVFAMLERLKKLRLCASITDQSVKKLAKCCLNLRYLDLSDCKITNESVYTFQHRLS